MTSARSGSGMERPESRIKSRSDGLATGSLFREQVLEARQGQFMGGISLAQPLSIWLLVGLVLFIAVSIVAFLFFGEYTKRTRVSGTLVPTTGLVTVTAPSAGVVTRLPADEGGVVEARQSLAVITIPRTLASGLDVATALHETSRAREESIMRESLLRSDQINAQIEGSERQLSLAKDELRIIEQEARTQEEMVELAQSIVVRYAQLVEKGYLSELQLQQQEQVLLGRIAARQAIERESQSLRRLISQLEQSLAELPLERDAQTAITERELAAIATERVHADTGAEMLIKSPVAGIVANRPVEAGQTVQVGDPLMTILPEGSSLEAQLMLPSRAVGFVEPGDTVLLRYQAFPYQKFGHHRGTVTKISRSAFANGNITQQIGTTDALDTFYRIRVALESQSITAYGNPEPLRPGMLVEADILGETRKLYEWVLEPLYSLYGRVASN